MSKNSGGQKSLKSIDDLKTKFMEEYPTEQLLSIPVVKLQNYKSVPVHLTEDDVRANIKLEEEEILQERIPKIRGKKQAILSVLSKLKSNPPSQRMIDDAARNLNNLLFEDIFTGHKDCTCKSCQSKSCTQKEAKKCSINKGVKTTQAKAKQALKTKWVDVLVKLQEDQPDQNVHFIEEFVIEELKKGIHTQLEKEIQGILANMIGRNTAGTLPEHCRRTYVFEEDRGKEEGNKYNTEELKTLFGQPAEQEPGTAQAEDVFILLSSIYAGGGSLVKLKSAKKKYEQEYLYLNKVDQKMQKMFNAADDKSAQEAKWISRNMNLRLSPAQNNLYNSGIGLKTGYCMIGGHGTGKTMMIQLEVSRAARLHTEEKTKAQILVVVWEMKAKELLESYKRFAEDIVHSSEVELGFLNKEGLCQKAQVEFKGRDTTSIINDVTKKLSETKYRAVYLFIDEIEVENPGVADLNDLIGKTPFCLGGEIFSWSNLEPLQVRLVVAVTTDSQDLAKLVEVDEADEQRMKTALASAPPEKIPTVVLWRVFRCSNAIQDTVEYLQLECSKKDKEFGFAVDPKVQIRGHDIRGDLVEWIPCNETDHMICPQECQECFLLMIDGALTEKLAMLEANVGVSLSQVTLIVSNFSRMRTPEDNRINDFFARRHPDVNVKLNFEMEGLEAPTVILIRNGGHLGSAISLGVSRATTKLVMLSTDDNEIMEKAVCENKVKKVDIVQDKRSIYDHVKIQEDSDQARWSLVGSALHSLHTSLPGYVQKVLKNFHENQFR